MELKKVEEMASLLHLKGSGYKSVRKGFKEALHNAGSNDLVFVGGSTFVVAEVI